MKNLAFLSLMISIALFSAAADKMPRSAPEEQGISSSAILGFVETASDRIDAMNSFMLVRHGRVVAEGWWSPYNPESRHSLYSLSKSFTSTAVGLAVAEGKMSIDDPVAPYFPEDAPAQPSDNLKAMRVRDLLAMSTGHHSEDLQKFSFDSPERLTKLFLGLPVAHKPGTHFLYNTPGTYMQSAIVQKVTGSTVLDYLRPRLFEPLGIENPTWSASPQGISHGGYGLSIRTEDIAKFGQLYLQKGQWQGRQLIPSAWIDAATSRQTSNGSNPASDWDQGYGYQFWRCRHGAFRGDGAFGQYCIVMPDQDAVIAITSGVKDMQAVMNLIWDRLLPAMQSGPMPADTAAQAKLNHTLASLAVRPPKGAATSPIAAKVSGRKFLFPANTNKVDSVSLEWGANGGAPMLIGRLNGTDQRIECGAGWRPGRWAYGSLPEQPAAAAGAWETDDTYAVKICFYETPFYLVLRLKFNGDEASLDAEYNVAFGPAKQPRLIGRAE